MAKVIERSNTPGRFTPEELKSNVSQCRAFWSSPEGRAAAAKQERENRTGKPAATGKTTRGDALTTHCKNILRRVEQNAPKL